MILAIKHVINKNRGNPIFLFVNSFVKDIVNKQCLIVSIYLMFYNLHSMIIIGSVIRMIYPSIDKLLNIVDSKYALVHIAARRSKQIAKDGYLQMPESEYKSKKNIGRALEEVAEGLIEVKKEDV